MTGTAVVKDSADHDVTAQFVVNTVDGKLTITSAEGFAATVTANDRTYDGTAKSLVNVDNSTLVGGEMQYKLGDGAYATDIPEATETGYYTVYYKLVPDEHHTGVDEQSVTVKIEADFNALNTAITNASAYYDTIKDSYPDIANALKDAIDAAQQIADNADASQSTVNEAAGILGNAKTSAEQKATFEVSKAAGVLEALGKALAGDSEATTALISTARAAIEALVYDGTMTMAENDARIDAILTQLDADLAAQRENDFEAIKTAGKEAAESKRLAGDSAAVTAIIDTAKAAIEALSYNETMTPAENKAAVDAILTQLDSDLGEQRTQEMVEVFETSKQPAKDEAEALSLPGDNDECKALINAAIAAIDALQYDVNKTPDDNRSAVEAIVAKLVADLEEARNADKAAFEAYKAEQLANAKAQAPEGDKASINKVISKAKKELDALEYDSSLTLEENKAKVDKVIAGVRTTFDAGVCGQCGQYHVDSWLANLICWLTRLVKRLTTALIPALR